MKVTRRLFCIALVVILIAVPSLVYASGYIGNDTDISIQAIKRMNDLNILNYSIDDSNAIINRAIFSKAIVIAAGFEESANLSKGYSKLDDISASDELSHYINTAVSKRLMDIILNSNKFYPQKEITFFEACMIMVRTLGYFTIDSRETWQTYYINKAFDLGIIKGLNLRAEEPLPLWAAAIMFDRLLNTKTSTSGEKRLYEQIGLYTEIIIRDTSLTKDTLLSSQVETDKGIFYVSSYEKELELGCKYRVKIKDNEIVKVFTKLNTLDTFMIDEMFDINKLPKNISYYFNGAKYTYNDIKVKLIKNSTVLLVYNDNNTSYEYGMVYNPIYSSPEIAKNAKYSIQIGEISLLGTHIINKYGQVIRKEHIKDGDIVHEVKDIYGKSRYIQVMDDKIEGRVTGISLNYVFNRLIEVDSKRYEISKYIDNNKLYSIAIDDKVSVSLGYDGKVVDINDIQYKSGPYIECIITGNSLTTDKAGEKQVLTSIGTYYYLDGISLDVGFTYKVVVDEGMIVKAERVQKPSSEYVVDRFLDNVLTYFDGSSFKDFDVPRLSSYYYQGVKVDYGTMRNIIKVNSTLIMVKSEDTKDYEYGIIIDPLYSAPSVFGINNVAFEINYGYSNISYGDVIYTVTDIRERNTRQIVVDNKVSGQITAMLPNKTYPTSIVVGGKEYEISKYFNYDKKVDLNIGRKVNLILGHDGKIVDTY